MKCKHCGAEMSDYHVFCTNCGKPLDMAGSEAAQPHTSASASAPPPAPSVPSAPEPMPAPVPEPPKASSTAAKSEKDGGRGKLPLYLAIAVLATAVLVMAFFLFVRPRPAVEPQQAAPAAAASPAEESASLPSPDPTPTAAPEPTPAALPDPGLALSEVEPEVARIREIYNRIMEGISANRYETEDLGGKTAYYDNGQLCCVMTERGADGSPYMRWYFYENDALIFSYYEGSDSHRLYFRNNALFRWRFCADSAQPDQAVNHDLENSDAFREWETTVLRDARVFQNR